METIDKVAMGFGALIALGFFSAVALYIRSSYRKGGWRRVRRDLLIAAIALAVFGVISALRHGAMNHLAPPIR